MGARTPQAAGAVRVGCGCGWVGGAGARARLGMGVCRMCVDARMWVPRVSCLCSIMWDAFLLVQMGGREIRSEADRHKGWAARVGKLRRMGDGDSNSARGLEASGQRARSPSAYP